MNNDDFPEIPDYIPAEFFDDDGDGYLFEGSMDIDDASVADFIKLMGYLSAMSPEERDKLRESLNVMANELSMKEERFEKTEIPSDLLFIGSDGNRVVKGLHYAREVLGGDGPVILPMSSPGVIIGAYSDEFIQSEAAEISETYETYEEQNQAWENRMAFFAMRIAKHYDQEKPESLDDFLKNID